jgi:WD40 repeat protein
MENKKASYLNTPDRACILILVILTSLSLASCGINTAERIRPVGQNPKEVPCVYPGQAKNSVHAVVFSPDSKTLITGCVNNQILTWDAQKGRLLKSLETLTPEMLPISENDFNLVYLSPDGKTVVNVLKYDRPIGTRLMQLWNIEKGELVSVLMGHEGWPRGIAFSSDSKILASGGGDKMVLLWDVQTGKAIGAIREVGWVLSLAFSPGGEVLAVGHSFPAPGSKTTRTTGDIGMGVSTKEHIGTINIWDVQTGNLLRTLSGHIKGTECMAFSPDGKVLASSGWDGTFYLWDIQTGKQLKALPDTGAMALAVAFSPDGGTLATGHWDGVVRLWDAETGVLLRDLRRFILSPSRAIRSVAFSPDGEKLAAGFSGGTAVMWNVKTGKRLRTITAPYEHPNALERRRLLAEKK